MRRGTLDDLRPLADLVRDRDLARVRKVLAHIARIEGEIAQLRAAREEAAAVREIDAARLTGADLRWMAWCDDRLRRLQAQMAALRATHEQALAKARAAFGRADVLKKLGQGASGDAPEA